MSERQRMNVERQGITRRFRLRYTDEINAALVDELSQLGLDDETGKKLRAVFERTRELKVYITANVREDGRLGEIFIRGDKVGGLIGGVLDTMAILFSLGLQHGIPMRDMTTKLRGQRFGPGGWTADETLPNCSSLVDLLAQWLEFEFPDGKRRTITGRSTE